MEHLHDRLSKWQVMALSRELHHDEAGISKICDLMLCAEDARVWHGYSIIYRQRIRDFMFLPFTIRLQTK